jgi:hypothetical protein
MRVTICILLCFLCATRTGLALTDDAPVDFNQDLRPLLERKCLSCHNPNLLKGKVTLHTREAMLTHKDPLLVPGKPEQSLLLNVVLAGPAGEAPDMPEEGEALTEQEVDVLRRWISAGAPWPEGVVLKEASKSDKNWWAYRPLRESTPSDSIDGFIRTRLAEQGLSMNAPANRRILIRRATYDLTGLPPTPEEVAAFEQDNDPTAYEKLVDRLLASPHYGERWGRHWLDVVRFGESNGYERNVIINDLWPFRDYIIRSLNDDKPFDRLMQEHLAGDVLSQDDPDALMGSAFLVAGPYDNVGNQDAVQAAQIRADKMDEMIRATSEAFLGMTVGCARCHDHKFDPITSEDYYGLYATFSGTSHGQAQLATAAQRKEREALRKPLQARKDALLALHPTNSSSAGNDERFQPVTAKALRFTIEATDNGIEPCIDELEIWTDGPEGKNIALGGTPSSSGNYPNNPKHRLAHINDGKYGNDHSWISNEQGKGWVALAWNEPARISRIQWARDRTKKYADRTPSRYRIETSLDGKTWQVVTPKDHQPLDQAAQERNANELAEIVQKLAALPDFTSAWIGKHGAAPGPFHVFLGGNPQKKGVEVKAASLSTLSEITNAYQLENQASEAERRRALAEWITAPENALTQRVLANRIWQQHFGTGIVDSPNDLGYMGGRPSHPELLDFLAVKLKESGWRIKPLHRLIMTSAAYQQGSQWQEDAAKIDGDSRLLWRFPPRRLDAEEIRDTFLVLAGKLNPAMGGAGFRLYDYQQDNVATYVPLDVHGPETYRRAVYHQNARASVIDLMTDFDQPDCAYSAPRRVATTTPLQALTMLNHAFTVDMAEGLAEQLTGESVIEQTQSAFQRVYQRAPTPVELAASVQAINTHGHRAFCRAILNSSELIYLD